MPPQENTLLGLLTGGRYAQSSDLPTAKQIGSSAIDSIIEADNKRKSKVLFESGKNIFGKPTDKFTQGDLDNLIMGLMGSVKFKEGTDYLTSNKIRNILKQHGDEEIPIQSSKYREMKKFKDNLFEELDDGTMRAYTMYGGDKKGYSQKTLRNVTLDKLKALLGY